MQAVYKREKIFQSFCKERHAIFARKHQVPIECIYGQDPSRVRWHWTGHMQKVKPPQPGIHQHNQTQKAGGVFFFFFFWFQLGTDIGKLDSCWKEKRDEAIRHLLGGLSARALKKFFYMVALCDGCVMEVSLVRCPYLRDQHHSLLTDSAAVPTWLGRKIDWSVSLVFGNASRHQRSSADPRLPSIFGQHWLNRILIQMFARCTCDGAMGECPRLVRCRKS
ncbi:hypothetical protein V8C35DRAFT_93432 [Trichoderma chlorosporum]